MSVDNPISRLREEGVRELYELVHFDGEVVALIVKFGDERGVLFTDWTDWTLRTDPLQEFKVPEYFWPPSDYSFRLVEACEAGCRIESIEEEHDEMGDVIGMKFGSPTLGGFWVRASGGSFVWGRWPA